MALLRAIDAVEGARGKLKGDEKYGADIVAAALCAPAKQIAENAGEDGDIVVEEVLAKSGNFGYNAATGEYGNLVKMEIIDPALVVRTALQNGASVAGLMLTTNVLITEKKDDHDAEAGAVA